ncbi:uncharacterized protein BX664DRAFT_145709 [Halteromyces radiatus]|uniref:uncharacterized protein n=1 Tax=Halteromyces radiatus TaxID=101107 RepID=UPI00221F08F3|nr:uncharacterized protein BX664DRAFT_145709 [Halteromyces radiatus]KAI8089962.1 hypothetical protein BX664DRAFT_145709 [Halteromyces radiatus]
MYLPCQFDILIHFHSSEHPISNYHFTHKNNTLTLDILQGERQITWVNSYVFTRCTIVHDVCHAITHSRHLHSLVTKGYNAAFLFMESSLDTISSSSSIIQQHLILLDTYVKHENQKHVNRQSNLIMEICYIGLTDFQCFDLLSNKKSISNEQILSYGLDRYMKPWTTTLDLTHILTTDDNIPKLLAMKITDHVSVSSYLYYLDLQQPYNNTLYPLSSSFTSLVSFLDQVETRKEKVGSNNDCVLIYLLRDYLVGRHHAIMFLDLEKHPHATDLPSIDQSLSLIQRLSSIQGFTSQNQINHFTIQINEQQLHDEQEVK